MDEILKAIILGVVQGLTEFLPVSSSGHLAVIEYAFGNDFFAKNIFFDVVMHFASVLAIILFFRKRIVDIFRQGNRRILLLIVAGSIPIGIVGGLFSKLEIIESIKTMPVIIGVCFLITAALLKLSDYGREAGVELRATGFGRSLLIGIGQVIGILPGVSRSGSTISVGLLAGLKREDAVMFSFFLAIPAILGVTAVEAMKLASGHNDVASHAPAILAGFVVSFVVSLVAIKLLLLIVRLKKFSLFAYYCLFAAAATFVVVLIK